MSTKPYAYTEETALENARTDFVFSDALAAGTPEVRRFSPDFKNMIARCIALRAEELGIWDNITVCQANVAAADASLDRFLDRVDVVLLAITDKNRDAPLYRTFLANHRVSEVKKYVLGQELDLVRGWVPLLENSEHPQLKELAPTAKSIVESADAATSSLAKAESAAREFRYTGNRKRFIDEANALRARAFGAIEDYVHSHPELNLPKDYASDFFRRGRRSIKPTLQSVDEQIAGLESELSTLREQRAVLAAQQDAVNRVRLEADRKAAQAELDRVQAEAAAALKRAEELKARINR